MTSLMAGLVTFAVLGHVQHLLQVEDISNAVRGGPGERQVLALWATTANNSDKNTGTLARRFARLLTSLTSSALLVSLVYSLAHFVHSLTHFPQFLARRTVND